jgi:hypothetical protein
MPSAASARAAANSMGSKSGVCLTADRSTPCGAPAQRPRSTDALARPCGSNPDPADPSDPCRRPISITIRAQRPAAQPQEPVPAMSQSHDRPHHLVSAASPTSCAAPSAICFSALSIYFARAGRSRSAHGPIGASLDRLFLTGLLPTKARLRFPVTDTNRPSSFRCSIQCAPGQ